MGIWFHSEDVQLPIKKKTPFKSWISTIIIEQGYSVDEVNYIFCSDDYLLEINRQHLNHDYYTDIITFPYTESGNKNLHTDMFISTERIKDYAIENNLSVEIELLRVMAHGILHQIGWNDKNEEQAKEMRIAEDNAIQLLLAKYSATDLQELIQLK